MYDYAEIMRILQQVLDTDDTLDARERDALDYIIEGLEAEKRIHWIRDEVEDIYCLDLDALLRKHNAEIMED